MTSMGSPGVVMHDTYPQRLECVYIYIYNQLVNRNWPAAKKRELG